MAYETHEIRDISASVRAPRVAVLINVNDAEWQHSCSTIIEFLSTVWGGKYNIIVPTDGSTIEPPFWEILELFDPDHITHYQKTILDWKTSNPEKYNQAVSDEMRHLDLEGVTGDSALQN